ncbi:UvrD/REP helicase family protein [Brevibacillus borstelensis AK1]|uniref:DNA 3'-5' helicase n=1 Tax=Brevibacillus borstelensis AK1 TaxID=1300222 RepID=M8E3H6_9BACL|nr:ATP-dependent helicase [Brevibacillus borstelensis]EMT50020.1 UvrD/REP helicase family protein [Brevibacillus borstelensis AK1]
MTIFVSPEQWMPADGLILEPAADIAVRSQNNTLIVAGPGAGKTELLAQRACYLLQTGKCEPPQKILAISFKVDSAENLAKRVEKRCGKELARRFESRTFDSFAKHLLDQFRLAIPIEYRPARDYDIAFSVRDIREIATSYLTERHPTHPNWQYEIDFDELFKKLTRTPLPLKEVNSDIYDWIVIQLWGILIHGKKSLKSTLTFPIISRLAELLLRSNSYITAALRATYSHVFLDEFQDTTFIQYDLLKTAFLGSSAILTAVGDDKQRIMGWAGAMPNAFAQFIHDFNASEIHLERNHRSAPRLVEIQNILAKIIRENSVEVSSSDKWKQEDGICQVWTFSDHLQEANYVASKLDELINKQKVPPRDLCILVKQQEHIYAKALLTELEQRGIKARIEKEYQDLLADELIQLCIDALTLAVYLHSPETWQRMISFLVDLNGIEANDEQDQILRMEYQLSEFIETLREKTKQIQTKNCFESIKELNNYILDYIGIEKIIGAFPKYARKRYLTEIIEKGAEKLAESFELYGDWKESIEDFLGFNSIPIMTIHKSKGLEYDTVIFLGLEDDAFWSFRNQTDADLCAFFVALSRAKRQVIFTFSGSREVLRGRQLQTVEQFKIQISSLYQMLEQANVEVISH